MREQTPVTVVSGNLGAGKTTLLNRLLERADGRLAVLVNDMGEVNVDAALLEGASLSREGIAELSNGCICCELRDDLATEVRSLARRYDFGHLVVESSGISEPAPVAQLFTVGGASARYEVDALVTVVDGRLLAETVAGERSTGTERSKRTTGSERADGPNRPTRETPPDAEDRPLSDLLVEQIEVSNVVLLNKCDLVDEAELGRLEATIAALQPNATIHRTTHCDVASDEVLGVDAFDPDELGELAGWQRALEEARAHGDSEHERDTDHGRSHDHRTPESVYGVDSVTIRRQRPLHPVHFASFLRNLPPSVVRLKGPCWIAGVDDLVIQVSGAGPSIYAAAEGEWIATLPEAQRRLYRRNHPGLPWDDEHGDRRTELVFIGTDLDGEPIENDLEACFVEPNSAVETPEAFPTTGGDRTVIRE